MAPPNREIELLRSADTFSGSSTIISRRLQPIADRDRCRYEEGRVKRQVELQMIAKTDSARLAEPRKPPKRNSPE